MNFGCRLEIVNIDNNKQKKSQESYICMGVGTPLLQFVASVNNLPFIHNILPILPRGISLKSFLRFGRRNCFQVTYA